MRRRGRSLLQAAPPSLDWAARGALAPVVDQGGCGSCYVFAALGQLEATVSVYFNSTPAPLSHQFALDCAGNYGSSAGCNGGWMRDVLEGMRVNFGGALPVAAYPSPYRAVQSVCQTPLGGAAGVPGAASIPIPHHEPYIVGEDALLGAVQVGPVTVGFRVENPFYSYRSGVFGASAATDCSCGSSCTGYGQNHAVVVVGYGVDAATGLLFWKAKNSWCGAGRRLSLPQPQPTVVALAAASHRLAGPDPGPRPPELFRLASLSDFRARVWPRRGSGWGEQGYFRIQRLKCVPGPAHEARLEARTAATMPFRSGGGLAAALGAQRRGRRELLLARL